MSQRHIRFGIDSLDALLGAPALAEAMGELPTTTICIAGPDGTGKSILALHLAAHFASEAADTSRILYVSTDLSYRQALASWQHFALGFPSERQPPFCGRQASDDPTPARRVALERVQPETLAIKLTAAHQSPAEPQREVLFVDLMAGSAGDDWQFVNRIVSTLDPPADTSQQRFAHFVVIDAVEGLETLSGRRDAHGEPRSRRSRIADLLRTAEGRCHVVFVIEESSDTRRLPEEFVSDIVVRLRTVTKRGYTRRTIEVAKARGTNPVRGQHVYYIRSGAGSTTGDFWNPDDPRVLLPEAAQGAGSDNHMAYVHVCHSIHRLYREQMQVAPLVESHPIRRNRAPGANESVIEPRIGFGIAHLDDLLSVDGEPGWPAGRVSAVIGDQGTSKTRLGIAYLAQVFANDSTNAKHGFVNERGVAVLLTNRDETQHRLAEKIQMYLPRGALGGDPSNVLSRIICRRLEVHDMSPAVLAHIVREIVETAKSELRRLHPDHDTIRPWLIRMVIDDWRVIRGMYPELREDDLFLPYLIYSLNRERISSLLICTQPGRPDADIGDPGDREFRDLLDRHLYTWRVPFFGAQRTAVCHLSPGMSGGLRVRELRTGSRGKLVVDPHFELYMGIEDGQPVLTPLRIQLYGQTEPQRVYSSKMEDFFSAVFSPPGDGHGVVRVAASDAYESQRAARYLQADRRLDHTLVLQVDEFWAITGPQGNGLLNLESYLDERTYLEEPEHPTDSGGLSATEDEGRDEIIDGFKISDPFMSFWPTLADVKIDTRRKSFDLDRGIAQLGALDGINDRVPYSWDFGFLMLRWGSWRDASRVNDKVHLVFEALAAPGAKRSGIGWRLFLEACTVVAKSQFMRGTMATPICAFDLDMNPEALSCLVLEIWASEIVIQRTLRSEKRAYVETISTQTSGTSSPQDAPGLLRWLGASDMAVDYRFELYRALTILAEVFRYTDLPDGFGGHEVGRRCPTPGAVAVRHWYATATTSVQDETIDPMTPARLPGTFSTRGDWSLGIAEGSRSPRLGYRALDLLSMRRANEARLRLGLGLPVRSLHVSPKGEDASGQPTALWGIDDRGRRKRFSYGEVCSLGATTQTDFHWLWRSQLLGYSAQMRTWHRWIYDTLVWLRWLEKQQGHQRQTAFSVYDEVSSITELQGKMGDRWSEFQRRCEYLVSALKLVTPRDPLSRQPAKSRPSSSSSTTR